MPKRGEQTVLARSPITRPVLGDGEEVVGLLTTKSGAERSTVDGVFRGRVVELLRPTPTLDGRSDVYSVRIVSPDYCAGRVVERVRSSLYASADAVERADFHRIVRFIWPPRSDNW